MLSEQLWDTRRPEAIRAYTHHFDFISDFLWLEDKKQLVATRLVWRLLLPLLHTAKRGPAQRGWVSLGARHPLVQDGTIRALGGPGG
jgi:hypothetical protein